MATPTASRSSALLRYGGFMASVGTARVAGVLITSVTFPVLVRRLGVETYGRWSYVVALCAFLEVIANPGLTAHVSQQVAAHRKSAADLIPDFLALRILSILVAMSALLLAASFESRADVHRLLLCYGSSLLAIGLTGSDFLLTSFELFHLNSILTFVQQALYAAGVLIFVRTPRDILWVPASILGSSLLTNLVGWFALWRHGFRPPLSIKPSRWRLMLVPSFHYAATTMLATVYHRTGHLVVRWLLGDFALGLYAAALRFVDLLRNFVGISLSVLMPRMALSSQSKSGLQRLVRAAVSVLAIVSFPLTLGTLTTAHLVVPWLLGANFTNSVSAVRWMSANIIVAPAASLLSGAILYSQGRYRPYLKSAAAGAFTSVLLSPVFGYLFGLAGVCVAFVLAEAAVAAVAYLHIPSDLRDLWNNRMITISAIAGLVMAGVVLLLSLRYSSPLLIVFTGVVAYSSALFLLGRKQLAQQFGGAS